MEGRFIEEKNDLKIFLYTYLAKKLKFYVYNLFLL